jgi:fibronectin-binding autotransporter adhesin
LAPGYGSDIGLWDSSGNLLASTTAYGDNSWQQYLWSSISPITLQAGQDYTIGSVGYPYGSSQNAYLGTATGLSSYFSVVGAGVGSTPYSLTDPTGTFFPYPSFPPGSSSAGNVFVGPNLQFSLAPFVYSQSDTTTVSTSLTGPVSVLQNGSGTTILTAQNSYSGGTIVSSGTLVANGPNATTSAIGTGNLTINSGGTVLVNGDNALGYDSGRTITVNAGGTLTINTVNTEHLSKLNLNGGSLTSSSTLSSIQQNYGTFNLDNGVTAGGSPTTSIISAQNVTLTQSGGTIFNVSGGTTNGIDLLVSGTFGNPPDQTPSTGLIKQGNGVMELTESNSYTGTTIVSAGTLLINNMSGSGVGASTVQVTGGTLGGNGTIGGATTIASGGNLVAGSSGTGALSFTAGLNLSTGASTTFLLQSTNNFTSINLIGNSVIYGGGLVFNITSYTPAAGDEFALFNMTAGATESGDFSSIEAVDSGEGFFFTDNGGVWSATNNGFSYQFSKTSGALTVTSVPEPSNYALFGLGALVLFVASRRIEICRKQTKSHKSL